MRSTLLSFFGILTLLFTFSSCASVSPPTHLSSPQLASLTADQTVALVSDFGEFDSGHQPFCSAVWVGHKSILTANHCVEGYAHMMTKITMIRTLIANGVPKQLAIAAVRHGIQDADPEELEEMPPMLQALHALLQTVPPVSSVGLVIPFIVQGDATDIGMAPKFIHYSQAVATDPGSDLALLQVIKGQVAHHAIASLAEVTPAVGSTVVITGHPIRNTWLFRQGYVSAYRHQIKDDSDDELSKIHGPYLQVSVNIAPGDSGGGIFDSQGHLIGIVMFIDERIQGGYCSHLDNITAFLVGQHLVTLKIDVTAKDPIL
jgi:hypothetical protein